MTTNDQGAEAASTSGAAQPVAESANQQVRHGDSMRDEVGFESGSTPPAEATPSSTPPPQADIDTEPADSTGPHGEPSSEKPLFGEELLTSLRTRWSELQSVFVDDPRDCVQKADGLVADVVGQLETGFAEARSHLERQWGRGEEASTEDLRVALKRYREFFDRLLKV